VSGSGFVSVSILAGDDAAEEALSSLLALLAARPGYRRGQLARSTDPPVELLLVTEWDGAGWWRRALGDVEVRLAAVPLLARARPGPSAFEVLASR
jgi:hypothetical protein